MYKLINVKKLAKRLKLIKILSKKAHESYTIMGYEFLYCLLPLELEFRITAN